MPRWIGVTAVLTAVLAVPPSATPQAGPGAITGRVAGRIVRPDGLPQAEADVVLARRGADGTLRQLAWRARSGGDGRYEMARVPAGRYLVLVRPISGDVSAAGRPDATLFPGVPVSEPGASIEVLAGLSTEGIDVWLVPAPRRFTLSGRVFGPGNTTTFDAVTIEMGRPGARATDVWNSSDGGGLFTIDPAPPGPLVFRALATIGTDVLTGFAATTVAANPVEDIRITVRPRVAVSGTIRAGGGRPLPAGLAVALVPQALEPSVLYAADPAPVEASGRFRMDADDALLRVVVRGLPAGWRVRRASGGLPFTPSALPLDLIVAPPAP